MEQKFYLIKKIKYKIQYRGTKEFDNLLSNISVLLTELDEEHLGYVLEFINLSDVEISDMLFFKDSVPRKYEFIISRIANNYNM